MDINTKMAARSLTKVKFNWDKIVADLTPQEIPKLNKLKSQVETKATALASLPESLPKIDWAFYKANASDPKLVEEIEKSYSNIKLEPPKSHQVRLDQLKLAKEQDMTRFQKFYEYAKNYIESAEVVKEKFQKMIPAKDMTQEDWVLTFPRWSITSENPSIAPHYGRTIGLTKEEAAAFEQPDPLPLATPKAWKDWEVRKKKFYS